MTCSKGPRMNSNPRHCKYMISITPFYLISNPNSCWCEATTISAASWLHWPLPNTPHVIPRNHHKVMLMPKETCYMLLSGVTGFMFDWLELWETTQPFEKFISTIHKLYNTAHICLLWNSKSNRKFQFTNYLNWKKHYILM